MPETHAHRGTQGSGRACVVRQQEDEVVIGLALHFHLDRGTEVPQQGRHWLAGNACEYKLLLLLVHPQHCALLACLFLAPLQSSVTPPCPSVVICCVSLVDLHCRSRARGGTVSKLGYQDLHC